jgi:uncharacterized protein (TIGR02246 family)
MASAASERSLEERFACLEARVAQLETVQEIANLEADYARTWDNALAESWADLYTKDGVFELVEKLGFPGLRVEGREALRQYCAQVNDQTTGVHLLHSQQIQVDGDTAQALVYGEFKGVYRPSPERLGGPTAGTGYYEVTYQKTDRGWKMKRRVERIYFHASAFFYPL